MQYSNRLVAQECYGTYIHASVWTDCGVLYTHCVLLQMFVGVLDSAAVLYVWDQLFLTGWSERTLENVCLVLIQLLSHRLLEAASCTQLAQVREPPPPPTNMHRNKSERGNQLLSGKVLQHTTYTAGSGGYKPPLLSCTETRSSDGGNICLGLSQKLLEATSCPQLAQVRTNPLPQPTCTEARSSESVWCDSYCPMGHCRLHLVHRLHM